MSEQPPEPPKAETQGWTAGQVALVVFCAGLTIAVLLSLMGGRIIEESLAAGMGTVVFLCLAIAAGLVGRQKRREENLPTATTSYRLAVWCLVLAMALSAKYHSIMIRETREQAVDKFLSDLKHSVPNEKPE
jgi:hypothetical protein